MRPKGSNRTGLEETRQAGKRPDLLLFPTGFAVENNFSAELDREKIEPLVKQAIASIEVRSSKYEALKYMAVREQQRDEG